MHRSFRSFPTTISIRIHLGGRFLFERHLVHDPLLSLLACVFWASLSVLFHSFFFVAFAHCHSFATFSSTQPLPQIRYVARCSAATFANTPARPCNSIQARRFTRQFPFYSTSSAIQYYPASGPDLRPTQSAARPLPIFFSLLPLLFRPTPPSSLRQSRQPKTSITRYKTLCTLHNTQYTIHNTQITYHHSFSVFFVDFLSPTVISHPPQEHPGSAIHFPHPPVPPVSCDRLFSIIYATLGGDSCTRTTAPQASCTLAQHS